MSAPSGAVASSRLGHGISPYGPSGRRHHHTLVDRNSTISTTTPTRCLGTTGRDKTAKPAAARKHEIAVAAARSRMRSRDVIAAARAFPTSWTVSSHGFTTRKATLFTHRAQNLLSWEPVSVSSKKPASHGTRSRLLPQHLRHQLPPTTFTQYADPQGHIPRGSSLFTYCGTRA